MAEIIRVDQAKQIAHNLQEKGKKIVLAGGCFDILHIGHITFLQRAKAAGDILFILLESDAAIKKNKGDNRPIHSQENRSLILSEMMSVDYIVMLSGVLQNADYDQLILGIKPAIIATTQGDSHQSDKQRQADMNNAKLVVVTENIQNQSTTSIAKLLQKEL